MVSTPSFKVVMSVSPRRAFHGLALVLLVGGLAQRWVLIDAGLSYPRHIDEQHVANPARTMLESQSYQPAKLNYPTLPIHLAAAGMAAGYVRWATTPDAKVHKKKPAVIGRVAYPHYDKRPVMRAPRRLFAALSVLAVLLVIGAARRLGVAGLGALSAGLLFMAAPDYMFSSWEYLNVDVVSTFFCAALVYGLVRYWDAQARFPVALFLGALVGLAAGSKYLHGALLLPVMGYAFLRHPALGWPLAGAAVVGAGGAFLVAVPHAILSPNLLLRALAYEAHHYAAKGHTNYVVEPGWDHALGILGDFAGNFGYAAPVFVLVGLVVLVGRTRRLAVTLLAMLLVPVYLLSQYKVHFVRNLLPVFPIFALSLAVGVDRAFSLLQGQIARVRSGWTSQLASGAVVVAVLAAGAPWAAFARRHDPEPESRRVAAAWLRAHGADGRRLMVDRQLPFDARDVPKTWVEVRHANKLHEGAKPGDYLLYGGHQPRLPDGVEVVAKLGRGGFERRRCPPNPRLTIAMVR